MILFSNKSSEKIMGETLIRNLFGVILNGLYLLSDKVSSIECVRLYSDTGVTHYKKVMYIAL